MEWLKKAVREIRIDKNNPLRETNGEALDLSDYPNLEKLIVDGNYLATPLTKLKVNNCPKLIKLFCQNNQLKELDLSQNQSLRKLDCDDYLFIEKKIKGIANTSLVRLDIRGGKLLIKSKDSKYIWTTFLTKYQTIYPELELIEINDLTNLANQLNEKTADDPSFLKQICPSPSFIKNKSGNFYWILDQLANTILARGLIVLSRLYKGQDAKYEEKLTKLAQQELKCGQMKPKYPEACLLTERKQRVKKTDGKILTGLSFIKKK